MDERFNQAAREGNIDALYSLIRENPLILERIDELPFVDTPLHVAAASGQNRYAAEILRLKPSFARKPNQDGFSPLQLALQHGHTRLVRWLINCDPELLCVQSREGMTPLHYVTQTENLDLIAEFLRLNPKSIEVGTIWGETALHIALKYQKHEAFKFQLRWLQYTWNDYQIEEDRILNRVDQDGNTVLHLAASINQGQSVKILMNSKINLNAINLEGLTALDILQSQPENARICQALWRAGALPATMVLEFTKPSEHLRSENFSIHNYRSPYRSALIHMSDDTRNVLFGLATLIVGATYPALTSNSPPSPSGAYQAAQYLPSPLGQNSTMTYIKEISSPEDTQEGCCEDDGPALFSKAAFSASFILIWLLLCIQHAKGLSNPIFVLLASSLLCFLFSISEALENYPSLSERSSLAVLLVYAPIARLLMFMLKDIWYQRKKVGIALRRCVLKYRKLPAISTELSSQKKL